jgi:hypothetical protein
MDVIYQATARVVAGKKDNQPQGVANLFQKSWLRRNLADD